MLEHNAKKLFLFTKMDLHMFVPIKFNVFTFFTVNVDKNAKPNQINFTTKNVKLAFWSKK